MGKRPKLKILVSSLIVVAALVALAVVPVMAATPANCYVSGEVFVGGMAADPGSQVKITVDSVTATGVVGPAGVLPWVVLEGNTDMEGLPMLFEVLPLGATEWIVATTDPAVVTFEPYMHYGIGGELPPVNVSVGAGPTQVSLTMAVTGSGTTVPSGTTWYDVGDVVTISATPAMGWLFIEWTGDVTGSLNPTNVTMTTDMVVTAVFDTEPPPPDCSVLAWWLATL